MPPKSFMLLIRLPVFVLVFAALLPLARAADAPKGGVPLLDGGRFALTELRGERPLLLKFWATWCGQCLQQMPDYRALHAEYGDRVRFLAVNVAISDPLPDVRRVVAEQRLEMPVAWDHDGLLWNAFDVRGTPTYVLLDTTGAVVYSGHEHDARLKQALDAVAGPDAPVTLTDIDGHPVDLTGTVVAYHIAYWCETYLRQTKAELAQRCVQFRQDIAALNVPTVGFATRSSSSVEGLRAWRERHGIRHALVFDEAGAFAAMTGVRDFPYAVILRDGEIMYGAAQIDQKFLAALGDTQ